jgi:hypothetical protein
MSTDNAMHTKPPIARFANEVRRSGDSVIAAVILSKCDNRKDLQ